MRPWCRSLAAVLAWWVPACLSAVNGSIPFAALKQAHLALELATAQHRPAASAIRTRRTEPPLLWLVLDGNGHTTPSWFFSAGKQALTQFAEEHADQTPMILGLCRMTRVRIYKDLEGFHEDAVSYPDGLFDWETRVSLERRVLSQTSDNPTRRRRPHFEIRQAWEDAKPTTFPGARADHAGHNAWLQGQSPRCLTGALLSGETAQPLREPPTDHRPTGPPVAYRPGFFGTPRDAQCQVVTTGAGGPGTQPVGVQGQAHFRRHVFLVIGDYRVNTPTSFGQTAIHIISYHPCPPHWHAPQRWHQVPLSPDQKHQDRAGVLGSTLQEALYAFE